MLRRENFFISSRKEIVHVCMDYYQYTLPPPRFTFYERLLPLYIYVKSLALSGGHPDLRKLNCKRNVVR